MPRRQITEFTTYFPAVSIVGGYVFQFALRLSLRKPGSRFCSYMLHDTAPTGLIHYRTALELAMGAIRGFLPRHLSDPPRSSAGGTLPLEDQYQKEFYRSFYTLLDGQLLISPEYVAKKGKGGGTIDFLVPAKKWGFELVRNRDKLVEHMERFEPGGAYYSMIKSNIMQHYIVLDFSTLKPRKLHPGNPLLSLSLSAEPCLTTSFQNTAITCTMSCFLMATETLALLTHQIFRQLLH